ncbi:MAG TPA: YhgE/Pip domain-containing protein, partial [Catenuloplanes sp.]
MNRTTRTPAAVRLAGLELRRFTRHRLTTVALVVLAVIPLLYGALYLYAFWDPYGRLNHIPAALVVEDAPATAPDGSTVHAGRDIADKLRQRQVFGWQTTDLATARRGLDDGRYHIVLRIPAGFSAALVTGPDPDQPPRQAQLSVWTDDATNYLSGQFARTAFEEVRATAAATSAARYFDRMLIGFTDLKAETGKAADGAGRVHDGIAGSEKGAGEISDGIDRAHTGTGRLADRVGTAATRTGELADGLATLDKAAGQLADGTARTAAEVRAAANRVDRVADRVTPVLADNAAQLRQAANRIATGADALAANLGTLPELAGTAVTRALAVQQQ